MRDRKDTQDSREQKKRSFFERLIVGNSVPKLRKKKIIRKVVSETPEIVPSKELPHSPADTKQKDVIAMQNVEAKPVQEEIIVPVGEEVVAPKLAVAELSVPEEIVVPAIEEVAVQKIAIVEPSIEDEKPKEPVIKKLTVLMFEDGQDEKEGGSRQSPALLQPTPKDHGPVPFDESALFVPLRSQSEETSSIQISVPVVSSEDVLSESEYFYLGDGKALTSLHDFLVYVESLSNEEWKRLVHDRKSNFVIWIETVFGTGKLARLIELADSQKEAVLYIRSFLGK